MLIVAFFREATTMKFLMTHGPSASPSTPRKTQSDSVASFSMMLHHMNPDPDVLNGPRSLYPQTPPEFLSVGLCWEHNKQLSCSTQGTQAVIELMRATTTDFLRFIKKLTLNTNGLFKKGTLTEEVYVLCEKM